MEQMVRERIKITQDFYRWNVVKTIDDERLNWSPTIAMTSSGTVYLPASLHNTILCYDRDLVNVRSFGVTGPAIGQLNRPTQLVCLGDLLYVLEVGNKRIQAFSPDGVSQGIAATESQDGIIFDDHARLFVWRKTIGFLNVRTKTIAFYEGDSFVKKDISCDGFPGEKLYALKEINGELLFPMQNGDVYAWDETKHEWRPFVQYPLHLQTFKCLSDIIPYHDCWFVIDHLRNKVSKFNKEKMLFCVDLPEVYIGRGVLYGDHLYLARSSYKGDGGSLIKVQI